MVFIYVTEAIALPSYMANKCSPRADRERLLVMFHACDD